MSDRTLEIGDVGGRGCDRSERRKIVRIRSTTFGLVDARVSPRTLSISIEHVYAHPTDFGAMRLGSGPMAPSHSISIRRAKRSKSEGKRANGKRQWRVGQR
jgi:hypothetical protein